MLPRLDVDRYRRRYIHLLSWTGHPVTSYCTRKTQKPDNPSLSLIDLVYQDKLGLYTYKLGLSTFWINLVCRNDKPSLSTKNSINRDYQLINKVYETLFLMGYGASVKKRNKFQWQGLPSG